MTSQDTTRRPVTAAAALTPGLRRQVAGLRSAENDVRARAPEAVHHFRVATRRLRSGLSGFEPLLDARTCRTLVDDLRVTAGAVAPAQDAEVVRRRVESDAAGEEDPVAARLHIRLVEYLADREEQGWQQAVKHLDDPAYDDLTRSLERLVDLPPWEPAAHLPADDVLVPLLRSEWSRFRRRARAALEHLEGPTSIDRLHEARKASKRARHVAESLTDVLGRPAKRLARAAEAVQEALGGDQDRRLVQAFLRDAQRDLALTGREALALAGIRETSAAITTSRRAELEVVLRAADKKSLRTWMR